MRPLESSYDRSSCQETCGAGRAPGGRAAPLLVLHPRVVAFGAFLFPEGDDAGRRGLPPCLLRVVLRFLY